MLQSFYLGQKIVGTDYDIDTLKRKDKQDNDGGRRKSV